MRLSSISPSRSLAFAAALLAALPAAAQTPEEAAAMNMQLAVETCMRHQKLADQLPAALEAAGYSVSPGMDESTFDFSAPGVTGLVRTDGTGYCSIQSTQVPLDLAEAIGVAVGERLFPGNATPGSPAGDASTPPAPCEGYTIWETQPIITVSYAQAGNSGECVNDGTSAIIISM